LPELPEAENIVRTLAPHVRGQRIVAAEFFTPRSRTGVIPDLVGRTLQTVGRYGKQILIEADGGFLFVELRMTGLLLWRPEATPHTRARLSFEDGAVCFDDIRQFGSIRWLSEPPGHLGPDPFEISAAEFRSRLKRRSRMLKPLLLDQHFLRGLGNIYVDEILYRARIHPLALASIASRARVDRLHDSMIQVLAEAIECGGSSISDYVNADGEKGNFQLRHRVYGREGQPCRRCRTTILRFVVGQRGTHICPQCQRR